MGHISRFCNKTCIKKRDDNGTAIIALLTALQMPDIPLLDWKWILDSGSTCHMSNKRDNFEMFTTKDGLVKIGNKDFTKSVGRETMKIASAVHRRVQVT